MLASSHRCCSDASEGVSTQQEKMCSLWGHLQRTDANGRSQPPARPGTSNLEDGKDLEREIQS